MLIKEVRGIISEYSEEELRVLLAEIYKSIPKKVREEKNIDELIRDIEGFKKARKSTRRPKKEVDIIDLKYDIDEFVDYAYKQYYFAPNSYVHKKERPKWRFKVSRYIKELDCVRLEDDDDNETALQLLIRLYEVLCYGCYYVIFSSSDTFNSIKMSQDEIYDRIIQRIFVAGLNSETVNAALRIMAANRPDSELTLTLLQYLKTPDSLELCIEQSSILQKKIQKGKVLTGALLEQDNNLTYIKEERYNILVEAAFDCYLELSEHEKACRYFMNNYQHNHEEVKLYILLRCLFRNELKDCWLAEYDRAVEMGLEPRMTLQKMYEYIIENDQFPEYMY